MKSAEIRAFYYISHIDNIDSIMTLGILSHNLARKVPHISIAMDEIQERRTNVLIPDSEGKGKLLHDFAPLYFDYWNPMLSRRRTLNEDICILIIDKEIIDIPGVVIADRNASRDYCKFAPAPEGLVNIDYAVVFAKSWINDDKIREYDNKGRKCAEILIPKLVPPKYIIGAFAVNDRAADRLRSKIAGINVRFTIKIDRNRFF